MIVNSTFEKVVIDIRSYSPEVFTTMTVTACFFTNYSTSTIIEDSYSSVNIQSSTSLSITNSVFASADGGVCWT